jgi:hypothetical protein
MGGGGGGNTNQNCKREEVKSRLNSGNVCYNSAQNMLSFFLLSKYIKIKVYITIICPLFCMGVKFGLSH